MNAFRSDVVHQGLSGFGIHFSRIDLAKHAAQSTLSYFKLAVLGGRKRKE